MVTDKTRILVAPNNWSGTLGEFLDTNKIDPKEEEEIRETLGKNRVHRGGGGAAPEWAVCVDPIAALEPSAEKHFTPRYLQIYDQKGSKLFARKVGTQLKKIVKAVQKKNPKDRGAAVRAAWQTFWFWANNYEGETFGLHDTEPRWVIAGFLSSRLGAEIDGYGEVRKGAW